MQAIIGYFYSPCKLFQTGQRNFNPQYYFRCQGMKLSMHFNPDKKYTPVALKTVTGVYLPVAVLYLPER
jgi:hypothetical protein